jgi:hypothetical protein
MVHHLVDSSATVNAIPGPVFAPAEQRGRVGPDRVGCADPVGVGGEQRLFPAHDSGVDGVASAEFIGNLGHGTGSWLHGM